MVADTRLILMVFIMAICLPAIQSIASEKPKKIEQMLVSKDKPIGYSDTWTGLRQLRFAIRKSKYSPRVLDKESIHSMLRVSDLELDRCQVVFSEIEEHLKKFQEFKANLVVYLEECKKNQEEFCRLLNQDTDLESNSEYKQAIELLFGEQSVGFESNQQAIAVIELQIDSAEALYGGELLPKYETLRDEIRLLRRAHETSEYGCLSVFHDISELRKKYVGKKNLSNYLKACEKSQELFCPKEIARWRE